LAVVVGVSAGAVIATAAGARRTETAYERFLAGTNAFDVLVTNGTNPENFNRQFTFSEVAALPLVADAASIRYYFPAGQTEAGEPITAADISPLASMDGRFGTELNEAKVIEGRLPAREDEVAMTPVAVEQIDAGVGTTMSLRLGGPLSATGRLPEPPEMRMRVVGVVAMQAGLPPVTGGLPPPVMLSPGFARSHPDSYEVIAVRLHGGEADISAFEDDLRELAGGTQIVTANRTDAETERSLGVLGSALRLMAALAFLVLVLVLSQVLVRQAAVQTLDLPTLQALGCDRGQLRAVVAIEALFIAGIAAMVGILTAVLLSPLAPIGIGRQIELNPGIKVDTPYLTVGAVSILVLLAGLSITIGWWFVGSRTNGSSVDGGPRARPSRVATFVAQAGFGVPMTSGVRMALERGQGRTAVPVRSTILCVTLGVGVIVGVLGFSSSLRGLLDNPLLYGWSWDVQIGDPFEPVTPDELDRLAKDDGVEALSVGTSRRLTINGVLVDTLGVTPRVGQMEPVVIEGRAASTSEEILLGTRPLRAVDVQLGDSVDVSIGDRAERFEVVGRGVLSESAGAARLGDGAALTFEGMKRLDPDAVDTIALVRVRESPVGRSALGAMKGPGADNVYVPARPTDLDDLQQASGLPSVLAGVLAIMAIATFTHALVSSVRRRRQDLAVMKALGCSRAQLSATVAWQAAVMAAVAVLAGIPLGVGLGRWSWLGFADQLGVPLRTITPWAAIATVAGANLVMAVLTAIVPGRWAAHIPASRVLQAN
jgi:ABC-type lipoprotein release transport system permease subunit